MKMKPLYTIWLCLLVMFVLPVKTYAQVNSAQTLEEIRSAYESIDFELAESRIQLALENYERFSPVQLTEIHTTFALIRYAQHDLSEAKRQFEAALRLTPELELNPVQASPKVIAFFEETADEIEQVANIESLEEGIRYVYVKDVRPAASLRSIVLPGWGQHYKGEKKKGLLLMGVWAGAAAGTVVAHLNRQQAQDDYLAVDPLNPALIEEKYRTYDSWHRARNNLFIGAAGIWLFAYIDAMVHPGRSSKSASGISHRLKVTAPINPVHPQLSVHFSF